MNINTRQRIVNLLFIKNNCYYNNEHLHKKNKVQHCTNMYDLHVASV
jgi:hypothetical protein